MVPAGLGHLTSGLADLRILHKEGYALAHQTVQKVRQSQSSNEVQIAYPLFWFV